MDATCVYFFLFSCLIKINSSKMMHSISESNRPRAMVTFFVYMVAVLLHLCGFLPRIVLKFYVYHSLSGVIPIVQNIYFGYKVLLDLKDCKEWSYSKEFF